MRVAMITCDELATSEAFSGLRDEWNALLGRSGGRTPYLRHEWLDAWWQGFGDGGRLEVLLVRDDGKLIGAAPMMVSRRTLGGLPVVAHHVLGLNVGDVELIAAEQQELCITSVMERILGEGTGEVIIVKGIRAGSGQDRALRQYLTRRKVRHNIREYDEIFIDTRGGIQDYRRGRSAKLWSNVRNRRKRLERLGRVDVSRHRHADGAGKVLRQVFDVSLRSWKRKTGTAIGSQERFRTFFTRLLDLFGRTGEVDVWLLHLDGTAIAYRFGVADRGVFLECDIGYDEAFSTFSPGTLLSAHSNEVLVEEGVSEINLGTDFIWKQEWSPGRRRRLEFVMFRPGRLYPWLLCGWQGFVARYRQARAVWQSSGRSGSRAPIAVSRS